MTKENKSFFKKLFIYFKSQLSNNVINRVLITNITWAASMSPSSCWVQRWFWAACSFQPHIVPALPLKGWGFLWGQVPLSQRSWLQSVSLSPCQTLSRHPDCHIWPDGNPAEIWCSFGIKWNGMGELTQINIMYNVFLITHLLIILIIIIIIEKCTLEPAP